MKADKMFVEWRKEHPEKEQLPEFVKEGIRTGNAGALQYYLDWVNETKCQNEVEGKDKI